MERERRRAAVMAVVDALLQGSLRPRVFGAFALDTSSVWSWGRAPRKAPKLLVAQDKVARDLGIDTDDLDQSDPTIGAAITAAATQQPTTDDSAPSRAGVTSPTPVDGAQVPAAEQAPYELDADWGVKTARMAAENRSTVSTCMPWSGPRTSVRTLTWRPS